MHQNFNKSSIMKTETLEKVETIKQEIQLVKGEFTPSEASDVVLSLIDQKINFHKIQRLQIWEGNHLCETEQLDDRIAELNQEKDRMRAILAKARATGSQLKINGILNITLAN